MCLCMFMFVLYTQHASVICIGRVKKKEFERDGGAKRDGRDGDKMRDKHRRPFGGLVHTVITRWKNTNYFYPPTRFVYIGRRYGRIWCTRLLYCYYCFILPVGYHNIPVCRYG